ncbi:IclR family transcriptional regulator [Epibacterium ulvae]|uniref:IclR family transcriptional regulator n=1 Tax=Epibacterium ulvae TaxID=1156985 RepID=UPI002492DC5C|nr:IclR family transcriptional regulator [Epibacterium ulvae]
MGRPTESSIVTKCAIVMDVLSEARQPLAFSEIVDRTGFVKSSCHRILAVLLGEQLISYDKPSRTYRTGARLHQWARSAWRRIDLQQVAAEPMNRLSETTKMNAALSILDGQTILYLRTVDYVPVRYAAHSGDHAPLHSTAAGKVFLAFMSEQKRHDLLEQLEYEKFTEFTLTSPEELKRELWATKTNGYGRAVKEEVLQVTGIAAPIFNEQDDVVACMSLWSLEQAAASAEVIAKSEQVIAAAEEVSKIIGWRPS